METASKMILLFLTFIPLVWSDMIFNTENIGKNLPPNTQASGIVFLESDQKVVVANDEGFICTMTMQGTNVNCIRVIGPGKQDFEDLCLVRTMYKERGVIYIALEFPPQVLEYHVASGQVLRRFDLSAIIPATSKHGLESLAFVPNATSFHGGIFYAGTQANGNIYKFELFLNSINSTKFNFLGSFNAQVGSNDLSGMCYNEQTKSLYLVVDNLHKLFSIRLSGGIIKEWTFQMPPVVNPEGIFIITPNTILIADDIGTVYKANINL